jgi:hypothetical protein
VTAEAVRTALRRLFTTWGRPDRVRVDNGAPWGAAGGDLPTALELWLWGLDVAVSHNRPRQCTENGRVERGHGVLARWAEPARCPSPAALQTAVTAASAVQRDGYPAVRGHSRSAAYPALTTGGRPYTVAAEATLFDVQRVWDRLAQRTWRRKVDKVGRISVYNRSLRVGRPWAKQDVVVGFDPTTVAWVIRDEGGTVLRTHPAPELSRARILALAVGHQRPPRLQRGKPRARLPGGKPYTR